MDNLPLIIFASIGWLLSLYFGFFRFKQYQWSKRKVQVDLFARLNQNGRSLYWKLRTLNSISSRNDKLRIRQQGVLEKYLDHLAEKQLLLQRGMVNEEMGRYWLRGLLNELRQLQFDQDAVREQLLKYSLVSYHQTNWLETLLDASSGPALNPSEFSHLYAQFSQ
ncbi:MAG: hypothetical protein AAF433_20725 [Bacteroidota bacterium]